MSLKGVTVAVIAVLVIAAIVLPTNAQRPTPTPESSPVSPLRSNVGTVDVETGNTGLQIVNTILLVVIASAVVVLAVRAKRD